MDFILGSAVALLIGLTIVSVVFLFLKQLQSYEVTREQVAYAILAALADGEKHSYQILKWIEANRPELGDSFPFFISLWHLDEAGTIKSRSAIDPSINEERRFYSLNQPIDSINKNRQ